MVSSTRQAIACIFALICIAVTANAQITPVKEPGGTITGKVTVKGKGAPGITVVLLRSERLSRREYSGPKAVTDEDGNYRIANVPPGSYRVIPVARVFVPAENADSEKVLIVNKDDTIEQIDFAMVRGAVITGRVVDAEGRPVVEEGVSVFTESANRNFAGSHSTTDDRGVYRIYGLRPGRYRVAAGQDNSFAGALRPYTRTYHPSVNDPSQATVVEVSEGVEVKDVDIAFTRRAATYTARGRIVDAAGQPLANVDYGIKRIEKNGSSSRSGEYRTNDRGEFKIQNLSPGKYSIPVFVSPESDLRFEETPFEIVDQDVNGLVIKGGGNRGGSISGVVVFEGLDEKTREQLEHIWVMAWVEGDPGGSRPISGKIASDSSFHIRALGAGAITFSIHSSRVVRIERVERDGVPQPRGIVMQDHEHIKGVRVVAQVGTASLRGKIEVINGTLPADARFSLWARIVGEDPANRFAGSNLIPRVDARGQFVVDGLLGATYEIDAGVYSPSAKLGYTAKKQVVITPGSTTTLNITVDLSSTPVRQ